MVQMNRFAGQKLRYRCREQTYGHQEGKAAGRGAGAGVMNWEIGIDMYTLMYIKWMTNKNLLYIFKKRITTTRTKRYKSSLESFGFPYLIQSISWMCMGGRYKKISKAEEAILMCCH